MTILRRRENSKVGGVPYYHSMGSIPNATEGEHVLAVCHSGPVKVAGKAIRWQSTEWMCLSKFCLHPAGDTPSSCRLFDAIVTNCVPVIEMATKGNVSIKIEDDDDVEVGGVADSLWSKKNEAFFIDIMEEEVKTLGTVTADDTLWEKLYKVNKKAKHFRKKGFPHYAAMTRILGDTTATGFNAHPSVQSPSGTDSSDPSFQLKDDGEIEVTDTVVSGKGKKVFAMKALKTTEPKESSKSKKRDSLSANLSASLSALAESSKRKVDILEAKHNAKSTSVSVTSQDHGEPQGLLAACIKTLNAMEDLDGASYTKGMKLLKDDPSWRPIFLGMSEQRKKDFLAYM
ncbi:hypothetical protein RHGRI_030869 [Rhododendron griersonianum]|nr:hypothetical protein RHGRI_030869 [Rhododendron griersonianum]KAG5524006.1 hypothetical protein RHGRI_030869 [Rhododendron griersonianum]KAG5524008.1 hypothetical protein RHGRI_030869 [Rhododendron griersonianum]